ncbi:MAG: tetratricopeptide repeat protein [Deltaproteobacteria bacterium]|jgi:predicted Zn-dependent protease|nr:tetratricopeptide repeat protein [Deltaproteobacteria bacterium]
MISNPQFSCLLDVALAASHKGQVADGRTILEGLLAWKPGFLPTLIGLAFNHVVVNEFDRAEAILKDEVLAQNPDDAQAQALLGLTLNLAGRADEASEILDGLKNKAEGNEAKLAEALMALS